MLVYLSVEDIVLIEKIEIELKNGFTVLTGETGAGKSILIDALSLILGKRSEKRFIRKGKDKGTVSAMFHLEKDHVAIKHAAKNGFIIENELLLKRQVLKNGRSFCYLNEQLITLNFMKEISNLLIEIHGQNEQIGLLDISNHKIFLDQWANLEKNVQQINKVFDELKEIKKELIIEKDKLSEFQIKKKNYQEDLKELNDLNLKENEIEELKNSRNIIMSSEKISSVLKNVSQYLNGDENSKTIYEDLSLAKKELESLGNINDKFSGLLKAIDQTIIEYREVELEFENCISSIEIKNLDIDYIENRLFNIQKIASKHNTDVASLSDLKNEMNDKILHMENYEEQIKKIEEKKVTYENLYFDKSKNLSRLRFKASKKLTESVNAELPVLKLENAKFEVKIVELDKEKWNSSGIDDIYFKVETNPGAGFNTIDKIASGGELSRLMLAIKVSLFSDQDASEIRKTIIFDEVDAGVGGAVADAIGKRLEKLGNRNQVLVVTHHPQVAARSKIHLKVNKNTKNNKTNTELRDLSYDDKLEELARMLSGAKITNAARKAAESLLLDNKFLN